MTEPKLSFTYNGKNYKEANPAIKRENNRILYTFPDGLIVESKIEIFADYGVIKWTNYFSNPTDHKSGLISALCDCDTVYSGTVSGISDKDNPVMPTFSGNITKVYIPKGSDNMDDDYYAEPHKLPIGAHMETHCEGGRSADTVLPFFDVNQGNSGIILAIGWTGQWKAQFDGTDNGVRIRTGIEDASFCMLPGESFRTGSVTMMTYTEGMDRAHNRWRRFLRNEVSPIGRFHGERGDTVPFSAIFWGGVTTEQLLRRWNGIFEKKLPFDYCWIDAGWYEPLRMMTTKEQLSGWSAVGEWTINEFYHPDRYRDVIACLNAHHVKMLVWMEPERIMKSKPWTRYIDPNPEDTHDRSVLAALQDDDVYEDILGMLSRNIEALSLGCYRQDFNLEPLAYWRWMDETQEDGEHRRGTTEIHYINNLYRLWDTLLARFPHLLIDNCASGGRRNDIEMLSRAVPMWRSDYQCQWDCSPEANQIQSASFAWWYPYSGIGYGPTLGDTYSFRSAYTNGMTVRTWEHVGEDWEFGAKNEPIAWAQKYFGEFAEIRHYFAEDFYLLIPMSREDTAWVAEQYHDEKDDSGILLVFRRPESPFSDVTLCLKGLNPACTYQFENRDTGEIRIENGQTLLTEGYRFHIADKRTSQLIVYKENV